MSKKDPLIILKSTGGLGNKIFDAITALYLYQKYSIKPYVSFAETTHNKKGEPTMNDIFPDLGKYVNIVPESKINFFIDKFCIHPLWKVSGGIHNLPKKIQSPLYIRSPYQDVQKIYNDLQQKYKNVFNTNSVISDKVKKLGEEKYIVIHIRYGDKLCLAGNPEITQNFFGHTSHRFPIYTPAFYTYIIDFLRQKSNIPIYILTDSGSLVEDFILSTLSNRKNIEILDTSAYEAFYLMKRAFILVLGISTLPLAAAIMNNHNNIYYVKRPSANKEHPRSKKDIISEEQVVGSNWHILDNKEYILNYNQELLKKMIVSFGEEKCQEYKQWWKKSFLNSKNIPGVPRNYDKFKALNLPPYSYQEAADRLVTYFSYAETDYFKVLASKVKPTWRVLETPEELEMAHQYLLFSENHRLCFLVNPSEADSKMIRTRLKKDTSLIAVKKITCNRNVLHNILVQFILLHYGVYASRWKRLEELEKKYAGNDILIEVFLFDTAGKAIILPQIAHMTENFYFTYALGLGLFHNKSLELLSHFKFNISFGNSSECFRRLNEFISLMIDQLQTLDIKRYIVFSSILLALGGLRDCADADIILSFGKKEKNVKKFINFEKNIEDSYPGIDLKSVLTGKEHFRLEDDAFVSYIRWAKTTGASSMDDMILNPKYHWFFIGVKMVDISFDVNKKAERPYPKALLDIVLFKLFFDNNIQLPPLGNYEYFISIIERMKSFNESCSIPRYLNINTKSVNWCYFLDALKSYANRILTPNSSHKKGLIFRVLNDTYPEFRPCRFKKNTKKRRRFLPKA